MRLIRKVENSTPPGLVNAMDGGFIAGATGIDGVIGVIALPISLNVPVEMRAQVQSSKHTGTGTPTGVTGITSMATGISGAIRIILRLVVPEMKMSILCAAKSIMRVSHVDAPSGSLKPLRTT